MQLPVHAFVAETALTTVTLCRTASPLQFLAGCRQFLHVSRVITRIHRTTQINVLWVKVFCMSK